MKTFYQPHYHLKEKVKHGTPLLPVSIHHILYQAHEENYFSLHWHDEIEMLIVVEGGILYTLDNEEIPLKKGEGLFINANRIHGARTLDKMPCEAYIVVFHPMLLHQNLSSDSYSRFVYPILHNLMQIPSKLTGQIPWQKFVLSQLSAFESQNDVAFEDSELFIKGILYRIWDQLYQHAEKPKSKDLVDTKDYAYKIDRIKPVLAFIHSHYAEEITLDELAGIIPMSKGQFCRSFKRIIGMSPMSYVIHYRIEESCHLLTDTNKKIADIARQVGFNNISYYNREFSKRFSESPKQYRLKNL